MFFFFFFTQSQDNEVIIINAKSISYQLLFKFIESMGRSKRRMKMENKKNKKKTTKSKPDPESREYPMAFCHYDNENNRETVLMVEICMWRSMSTCIRNFCQSNEQKNQQKNNK